MHVTKGMIQVEGKTYRIARVLPHVYEAVRLLDNQVAGWFTSDLSVIAPHAADLFTLRSIARQAVREAKTSWRGRLDPRQEPPVDPADLSGVRRTDTLGPEYVALRLRGGG
jgi:hypothetical protein